MNETLGESLAAWLIGLVCITAVLGVVQLIVSCLCRVGDVVCANTCRIRDIIGFVSLAFLVTLIIVLLVIMGIQKLVNKWRMKNDKRNV